MILLAVYFSLPPNQLASNCMCTTTTQNYFGSLIERFDLQTNTLTTIAGDGNAASNDALLGLQASFQRPEAISITADQGIIYIGVRLTDTYCTHSFLLGVTGLILSVCSCFNPSCLVWTWSCLRAHETQFCNSRCRSSTSYGSCRLLPATTVCGP